MFVFVVWLLLAVFMRCVLFVRFVYARLLLVVGSLLYFLFLVFDVG